MHSQFSINKLSGSYLSCHFLETSETRELGRQSSASVVNNIIKLIAIKGSQFGTLHYPLVQCTF